MISIRSPDSFCVCLRSAPIHAYSWAPRSQAFCCLRAANLSLGPEYSGYQWYICDSTVGRNCLGVGTHDPLPLICNLLHCEQAQAGPLKPESISFGNTVETERQVAAPNGLRRTENDTPIHSSYTLRASKSHLSRYSGGRSSSPEK